MIVIETPIQISKFVRLTSQVEIEHGEKWTLTVEAEKRALEAFISNFKSVMWLLDHANKPDSSLNAEQSRIVSSSGVV